MSPITRNFCIVATWLMCLLTHPAWAATQISDVSTAELVQQLADSDKDRRRNAAYELVRRQDVSEAVVSAFAKVVSDEDNQVRFQALLGLSRAGQSAAPAIPNLIACLGDRDDQVRFRAAHALGMIGVPALESLVASWKQGNEQVQWAVAQTFATIGPPAKSTVPLLIEALNSSTSGDLLGVVAESLVAIAPGDEATLITLAAHQDAAVRRVGIIAIAALDQPSLVATDELRRAASDEDAKIRETAIIALGKSQLSREERAAMIEKGLLDPEKSVRAAAIAAMRNAGLTGGAFAQRLAVRLDQAEPFAAVAIVKALAVIGSEARASLPPILSALDRQLRAQAGQAAVASLLDEKLLGDVLASFGQESAAELLQASGTYPGLEVVLAQALANLGQPVLNVLGQGLQSESESVRWTAAQALANIAPLDDLIVQKLCEAAEDPAARVRAEVVNALLASESQLAKATLLRAADDQSAAVRANAVFALAKYEFDEQQLQVALDKFLNDEAAEARASGLQILTRIPASLTANLDRVVELVSDPDDHVRAHALQTLASLKKDDVTPKVNDALLLGLADKATRVRIQALQTSDQLVSTDQRLLSAVAANLSVDDSDNDSADGELLRVTLGALTRYAEQANSFVPQVIDLLQHPQASVRKAAVTSLMAIEQDKEQLVAQLLVVLEDSEWEVRQQAGGALGKLGPRAKAAVPRLFVLLRSEEDADYANAALKEVNTAPPEALPLLLEQLDTKDRRVGFYAITLLGKIGPPAAEALPRLEAMLKEAEQEGGGRGDFRKKILSEAIESIQAKPES